MGNGKGMDRKTEAKPAMKPSARGHDRSRGTPRRALLAHHALAALLLALAALLTPFAAPAPAAAQNLFAPVARVNDSVITRYELSQRVAFLTLLRAPGDIRKLALDQLVSERLQAQVGKQMGLSLTEEEIRAGMEEFASRANLTAEQFVAALGQGGVAAETFRDFVANGLIWRKVVRARFAPGLSLSEIRIDNAIANATPEPGIRVLLSEIMLPADTPANKRASRERAKVLRQIESVEDFADAARQYSIAPSRRQGGEVDWRALSSLPPALARMLRSMEPGDVTPPIDAGDRIALFLLRDRKQIPRATTANRQIEYATLLLPGGRSAENLAFAARLDAETDRCEDLHAATGGLPDEALAITTSPAAALPTDISLELARMDEGEISTALTRNGGQTLLVLMLCRRTNVPTEAISREQVRQQLANQQLVARAESFLAELKANAFIEYYDR